MVHIFSLDSTLK